MDGFTDRRDAGRRLGRFLAASDLGDDVVVLALPLGGIPVAGEVAAALNAPLDVVVVRKLRREGPVRGTLGALAEGDVRDVDWQLVDRRGISIRDFAEVERRERTILEDRIARIRHHSPALDLTGRTALIVDEGISSGASARAACESARRRGAARILVAVPLGSADADRLVPGADAVYCLRRPDPFGEAADYYREPAPVDDALGTLDIPDDTATHHAVAAVPELAITR